MRPLFREHVKRDGTAKRRYRTREAALRGANLDFVKVYQCGLCGDWHRASITQPARVA